MSKVIQFVSEESNMTSAHVHENSLKEATQLVEKVGLAIIDQLAGAYCLMFGICPQTTSGMLEFPLFSNHFHCFKRYSSYFRGQFICLPLHFNSG